MAMILSMYNRMMRTLLVFLCLAFILTSCKKEWLEEKPKKSLVVPTSIKDFQALLDNATDPFNGAIPFNTYQSSLDEIGAGDFYQTDNSFSAKSEMERNAYLWQKDIFGSNTNVSEWNYPFQRIFYANIVLEGIEKIEPQTISENNEWSQVKGSGLFFRAYNHYNLAQLFCKGFDNNTSSIDLGLPIRLTSDFNIKSERVSVKTTYESITKDLKAAAEILPVSTPINNIYVFRPTKLAALAMLARVFLTMEDYENALMYADKALSLYDTLANYNLYTTNLYNPFFKQFMPEVIFNISLSSYLIFAPYTGECAVDSTLYKSYVDNDLRKQVYFVNYLGLKRFKGTYTGNGNFKFSGLATDELYLIRAECLARKGMVTESLKDINKLLSMRWVDGTFSPMIVADKEELLTLVLSERRKELCFRGIRWSDLKRLNKDNRFKQTLTRVISGKIYTLEPNDPRYVLPIPRDVIQLSGMSQNIR